MDPQKFNSTVKIYLQKFFAKDRNFSEISQEFDRNSMFLVRSNS